MARQGRRPRRRRGTEQTGSSPQQAAAEQGDPEAQYKLGLLYQKGRGVEQDYAKAVEWFQKAADKNHALAQYELGVAYRRGQGVEKDYAKALKWYRKAADQGCAPAQCDLGFMYDNGHGRKAGLRCGRPVVSQGGRARQLAPAQSNLGVMYENGRGVEKDPAQAVQWYRKAAEQGYALGQDQLGYMYSAGRALSKTPPSPPNGI